MRFSIRTHDAWGVVPVGEFDGLEEARAAFATLRQDPWYRQDGSVRAAELVAVGPEGSEQRLDWVSFTSG